MNELLSSRTINLAQVYLQLSRSLPLSLLSFSRFPGSGCLLTLSFAVSQFPESSSIDILLKTTVPHLQGPLCVVFSSLWNRMCPTALTFTSRPIGRSVPQIENPSMFVLLLLL